MLPGAFLLVWGLHWFLSASYQTLTGTCNVTCKQRAVYHKIVFFPEPLQVCLVGKGGRGEEGSGRGRQGPHLARCCCD